MKFPVDDQWVIQGNVPVDWNITESELTSCDTDGVFAGSGHLIGSGNQETCKKTCS